MSYHNGYLQQHHADVGEAVRPRAGGEADGVRLEQLVLDLLLRRVDPELRQLDGALVGTQEGLVVDSVLNSHVLVVAQYLALLHLFAVIGNLFYTSIAINSLYAKIHTNARNHFVIGAGSLFI